MADVLTGKSDKVDKGLIEHSTKRKRRRANRINLIGGDNTELTAREDIGFEDSAVTTDILTNIVTKEGALEESGSDNLLESTSSPLPPLTVVNVQVDKEDSSSALVDISEFEVLDNQKNTQLTSNVAILAGEFAAPIQVKLSSQSRCCKGHMPDTYVRIHQWTGFVSFELHTEQVQM